MKKDYNTTNRSENNLQEEESKMAEEEAEEALSLSGLIINSDETEPPPVTDYSNSSRSRSTSEPSDFFEFFCEINNTSEMSHAEDIIFCGKLIPSNNYKEQLGDRTNQCNNRKHRVTENDKYLQSFVNRRRSESMSELNAIGERRRSNSTNSNLMIIRNSRSLDYQRLYGKSDKLLEIERSLSAKSSGSNSKTDVISIVKEKVITPSKPRWYFLKFGLVKFPPEMALRDIKNRQVRRNSGSLFTSSSHAGERDLTHKYDRKSSWDDLLKVLSCKDDASVSVTTSSFGCLQHA